MQQVRQQPDGIGQIVVGWCAVQDAKPNRAFVGRRDHRIDEFAVLFGAACQRRCHARPAVLPVAGLDVLEGQVDDRIALKMLVNVWSLLPHRQIGKHVRAVVVAARQPGAEHRQVQGLAEAARARKQQDRCR